MKKYVKNCKQIVNGGGFYKGFTLIELLAVIVILAIIAVIASPIIVGIIDDSRLKGKENSVNGLMEAVNVTYTKSNMTTTPLSLPITANINNGVITAQDGTYSVEVEYSGEKPVSGVIKIDVDGNLSAINVKYSDNYICSMGLGENGCNNKRRIFTGMVKDPNETSLSDNEARYIFEGANPNNYIMLKENGVEQEYRIISVEKDGSIKVVRQSKVTDKAFDSRNADEISGPRLNSNNPYCMQWGGSDWVYTGGTYYGCNIWGKDKGIVNGVPNTSVTTDSEINTYLNNIFYSTLDDNVKNHIITHSFNVTGNATSNLGTNPNLSTLYGMMNGANKEEWAGKIGLPTIYDWFIATTNTACEPSTAECGLQNYLKTSDSWWTMSPYSASRGLVWFVIRSGYASYNNPFYSLGVRPVFYLTSNIALTGDGSQGTNAYRIKS